MSEARIHYSKPYWWTEIERRDRKTRDMVKGEGWRFYGDYTWEKDKLKSAGVPMYAWWTDQPLSASPFTEEMDDDAKAAMADAQEAAAEAKRQEAKRDYGTVHYAAPFWWVWIKRNDYKMKDLFKGEGWRFHGERSYAKERLEDAGVPEMAWYTDQPTSAAPFRDEFDADARAAFGETVQDDEKSRAADANIDVPCPDGMSYLPYQRAGIKWITERQNTLLGDQMGLGKTVQVLGAINNDESIRNVLCVVPASLTANWAREAQKWLTRPAMIVNLKTAYDIPDPAPPGEINFLITNYERLIDQKGKDEKKILETDGIAQKDEKGIRRALQKMRKEPNLRDVLVVADRPDKLDVSKALKPPRNADDWPEAEVYIANDMEELREIVGQIRGGSSAIIAQHDRNKGLQVQTAEQSGGPAHIVIIPIDKNDKTHKFIRDALNEHKWHILVKDQIHVLVTRGRGFGLHSKLLEQKFDMLACDEAHVMSNPKSKQTIAVVGKEVKKGARSKAKTGIAAKARKLVFATGTPIRNKPVETWPILHALAPKTFPEFFPFAKRYCGAVQNGWGWDFSGATRRAEYEHVLRTGTEHHGLMIRRLKEDVLTDLPPKFRHVVPLEVDTPEIEAVLRAEQEIYDKYRSEVEKMIGSGTPPPKQRGQIIKYAEEVGKLTEAGPIPFAEIAKVKAMVGAAKVEPAARLIAQMLEGGDEKVVVFGEHYAVIDGLEEALKEYGVVQITGRTPNADRMKIVDQFQTDKKTRVFIGNIKAAGVGLTLTAASTVVMVEATWVPALNEQAEDRCHRIGTVDNVNVLYLVFDGSIDQMVLEKVVAKMEVARDMLDAKITEVEKIDVEAMYQELEEAIEVGEIEPTFAGGPERPKKRFAEAPKSSPRAGKKKPAPPPPQQYTEAQRDAALTAMRSLAMVCDGARRRDCMGFSGVTTKAGHWLAAQDSLDNRQTQMAVRIATLHQRQLPSDLLSIIGVEGGAEPERIDPPERYRLMYRQLTWVVEYMTTMREEPIQRRMYWPVTEYEGSMPSRQGEPVVLDPSDTSCFVGEDGSGFEELRVCVDGSMNAEEVDEWVVPEPKSRYPMRWHIGQWQRELKKGWTDIPFKWMERAPRRKAADVVEAPSVEEAKLFISDADAFERMTEVEGKGWASRETLNIDEPNTFFDAKDAFGILRSMIASGEVSRTIRDPNTGETRPILIGDITGSAGFVGSNDEIYVVLSDGQIALFGDTADAKKVAKARKVLRVV